MAQHPKRLERLHQRRKQGLTHRELASEFDLSRPHIGRLLRQIDTLADDTDGDKDD